MATNAPSQDRVEFPARITPIGMFFFVVPAAVTVAATAVLAFGGLPIAVLPLLLVVIGCCCLLIKEVAEDMGQVTLEWTQHAVTVTRVIGSNSYAWSKIERIEAQDPGATFCDPGRNKENRTGIAFYLYPAGQKQPKPGAPPDFVIVDGRPEATATLRDLVDRLTKAKQMAASRDSRRTGSLKAANAARTRNMGDAKRRPLSKSAA